MHDVLVLYMQLVLTNLLLFMHTKYKNGHLLINGNVWRKLQHKYC